MAEIKPEPAKTAFHKYHLDAGARMVEFAGYHLPVQYKGTTAEHLAVRKNVGLFDLSHMGELKVSGPGALDFLQKVTTNDVAALQPGMIQYSCMTRPDGGIVDDLLVFRLADCYWLIVNAANIGKDLDWLKSHAAGDVLLTNRSAETSLLAIQGPSAQKVLSELTAYDLDKMAYYTSAVTAIAGVELLFSRTGYTGEDGFEIYIPPEHTDALWKAITEVGSKHGMELIGLGARDTLRLEMKMALYGHDIDATTTPIEGGLSWIVSLATDFIGKDIIEQQKMDKPKRRLVCLELEGRAFPRHGHDICVAGQTIGQVTSGTFSPSLRKPIALGYVPREYAKAGSRVEVAVRDKMFPAVVVKPPFYKHGSHR